MLSVRIAPNEFRRGREIIHEVGDCSRKLGQKALIIGGTRALAAVRDQLIPSLHRADVEYTISPFQGFCSPTKIEQYRRETLEGDCDLLIGVGGGRVLDTVKAASNMANKPLVTIPTIAATCAAWTPLAVIYDDQGTYQSVMEYVDSPRIILVDYDVLAKAPVRYLASGIADSLAKWHEITLNTAMMPQLDLTAEASLNLATQCNRILLDNGPVAIKDASASLISKDLEKIIDTVIFLVGVISGLAGEAARLAIGHTIYNCLSNFRSADGYLHGEKVAFGLAVQQVLQGKPETEISAFIKFIMAIGVPGTLAGLGIVDPQERSQLFDLIAKEDTLINAPLDGSRTNIERAFATVEHLALANGKGPIIF